MLSKSSLSIERLLIVRNDRVGDLVLTLPAFEYARKAFPQAEISALVAEHTAVLLDKNANLDRVIRDDGKSTSGELAARLRSFHFDAVAMIHTTKRNCLAVWRAGIPVRAAWASRPIGLLLGNRRVWLRRSHPPVHESRFALAFVQRLKADPAIQLSAPSVHVDQGVRQRVKARVQADLGGESSWFGVHPGSYKSTYNWPSARYVSLIERLARHGRVVVTGGPGEFEMLRDMKSSLCPSVSGQVAFYHEFDLTELAAAIALADVFTVSNTGPMHLAGVLGTPLVALFSAHPLHSREKWAPFGDSNLVLQAPLLPGELAEIPPDKADEHMCRISVEEVVQANLRQLTPSRLRHSA